MTASRFSRVRLRSLLRKGPEGEGGEGAEHAHEAAERAVEAIGHLGGGKKPAGHGGGHGHGGAHSGGHAAGGHGGGKPHAEHAKPAEGNHPGAPSGGAEHGAPKETKPRADGRRRTPSGQKYHERDQARREAKKPAEKPRGGGGDEHPRDDHGRFASKGLRGIISRVLGSFEGNFGASLPSFDRQQSEEGNVSIGHADKAAAPMGVASPDDFAIERDNDALPGGNDAEMVADFDEKDWELGTTPSDDPDYAGDGGIDFGSNVKPPAGTDFEESSFSPFDLPVRTELRSAAGRVRRSWYSLDPAYTVGIRVADGRIAMSTNEASPGAARCVSQDDDVSYNAGGDGFDDYPWGQPNMFQDRGAFQPDDDAWIQACRKQRREHGEELQRRAQANQQQAALCIVFDGMGRVLTASRWEPPYEMAIPGGKIEDGESPEQAAVRELYEETGVEIHTLHPACTLRSPTDGRIVHVFVADEWEGEPRPNGECPKVGWLSPEQLFEQSQIYRQSVAQMMEEGCLIPPGGPGDYRGIQLSRTKGAMKLRAAARRSVSIVAR